MRKMILCAFLMLGIVSHADTGKMVAGGTSPAGMVTLVGADENNALFKISGAFPSTCAYGYFYLDIQSSIGKARYATVLQAYAAGISVNYLVWNNSGYNTPCFVNTLLIGQ